MYNEMYNYYENVKNDVENYIKENKEYFKATDLEETERNIFRMPTNTPQSQHISQPFLMENVGQSRKFSEILAPTEPGLMPL